MTRELITGNYGNRFTAMQPSKTSCSRFGLREPPAKKSRVPAHGRIGRNIGSFRGCRRPRSSNQLNYTNRSGEKVRGERTERAQALKEPICDVVRSPKRSPTLYSRAHMLGCAVSARAREAATVILQIISCERAILLKSTRQGGDRQCRTVHSGPLSRARARTRAVSGAHDAHECRGRCTRKPPSDEGCVTHDCYQLRR